MEFGASDTPKDHAEGGHNRPPAGAETAFSDMTHETVLSASPHSALSDLATRGAEVEYAEQQPGTEDPETVGATDDPESASEDMAAPPEEVLPAAAAALLARAGPKSAVRHELLALSARLQEAGIDMDSILSESHQAVLPHLLTDKSLLQIAREQERGVAAVSTQMHAILRRLASHPLTAHYMTPGAAETFAAPDQTMTTSPYAEPIRLAKAAAVAEHGPLPRWSQGQTANILRILQEHDFDVVAHIPVSQTDQWQVVQLTLAGHQPAEVAQRVGISRARVSQLVTGAVEIIKYIVPAEELPADLPAGFLEPSGNIPTRGRESSEDYSDKNDNEAGTSGEE